MVASLANSRTSTLCVHPFDPLSAPWGSHEWICKVLGFPRNLVVPELRDAHGVGRLAVICQMNSVIQRSPPPMIRRTANRFLRLTSALVLYVASTTGSLADCGAPFQSRWHRT